MSELNPFKAVLVEEAANKKFTINVVNRSLGDLPNNDLLVNVHYSSLNFKDALSASGNKRVTFGCLFALWITFTFLCKTLLT